MLDKETKQNLAHYLEMLESPVIFSTSTDDSNDSRKLLEFLNEIAQMTEKVTIEEKKLSRTPSFEINPLNGTSGIAFAGIPLGHEFSSFFACPTTGQWSSSKNHGFFNAANQANSAGLIF